jgi:hypothetical protein
MARAYQIPKSTPRTRTRVILGESGPGDEAVTRCHDYGLPLHEGESNESVADLASQN